MGFKFVKLKYFNHNQVKLLSLSTVIFFQLSDIVMNRHFRNLDKGN